MTDSPLECSHWRHLATEYGSERPSLGSIRLLGAITVRNHHADVRGRKACIVERRTDGTHKTVAIIADARVSAEGQEGMDALLTGRAPNWINA